MATTYEPIATTTLASGSYTINFTSIPQTYTDLRVVITGTFSVAGTIPRFIFNSTPDKYSFAYLNGDGTTAGAGRQMGQSFMMCAYQNGGSVTIPSTYVIDVFSYTAADYAQTLVTASQDKNGSGTIERMVGRFASFTAITSINFDTNSGQYNAGTTATLYGIKAA